MDATPDTIDTRVHPWRPPEIGLPLQVDYHGKKYYSVMRGAAGHDYILMDIPHVNRQAVMPDFGVQIHLRYLFSGVVYGFTSAVSSVHPKLGLVAIKYPNLVEELSLRASERISMLHPVSISNDRLTHKVLAALVDLSMDGAMVSAEPNPSFYEGAILKLDLHLPGYATAQDFTTEIKKVKETATGKVHLGLKFTGDDTTIRSIQKFYRDASIFLMPHPTIPIDTGQTFRLGEPLVLHFKNRTGDSILSGWKTRGKPYFLVERPPAIASDSEMKPGASWHMLFDHEGKVLRIKTYYHGMLKKERLLVFGNMDDQTERRLREHERYPCRMPGHAVSGGREAGRIFVEDISFGGIRFASEAPPSAVRTMQLDFALGDLVDVKGQDVEILSEEREGRLWYFTGRFGEISSSNRTEVDSCIGFLDAWAGSAIPD